MRKTYFKLLLMFLVILTYSLFIYGSSYQMQPVYAEPLNESSMDTSLETKYTTYLKNNQNIHDATEFNQTIAPSNYTSDNLITVPQESSLGYHDQVVKLEKDYEITIQVDVPQTAFYNLMIDYYDLSSSILPQEGMIKINGDYPFYEARQLVLPMKWTPETKDFKTDRYDNEILPKSTKVREWQQTFIIDGSFMHSDPLKFRLNKGINEITFISKTGSVLIGDLKISSPQEIRNYEDYIKDYQNTPKIKEYIPLEAEFIDIKSDPSIRLYSDLDPKAAPYHTKNKLLNAIEPDSWRKGGQSATWNIHVEETGLYKIAFKYKQYSLANMPSFRSIKIDEEIPFSELKNYPFHYTKEWKNETLHGSDGDFYFYLTKGDHTLTLTVTLDVYRPIIEEIETVMDGMNDMALDIKRLTGNKVDKYRDWKLTDYIPGIEDSLNEWADALEARYHYANSINNSNKDATELANLKLAASRLRKLAEEPNQLPNHMSEFTDGTSSIAQLLGDQMLRLLDQPLGIEKMYIYHDESLPNANAGFFLKLWEGIKRFFLSFRPDGYSAANEANGEIEIWVNRPRQYVEIMQKMIDEEFTPETGINIKLSLMPDENKLILANAADTQPDIAMGVNHWLPYELAIRNAALDLRQFEGYEELVANFSKGAMIPYVFEEGVYAVPETQDFWVTFYRTDIFDKLNLEPPSTWDDVVNILPELQRQGMNFYEPLSLYEGFKPFVATMPFIYQFGGELYSEDGMQTAIDSEETVEAIKFMTDLFKIYNIPERVPNFYHHFRYGTLPVGIANTATYIQLSIAAPEIKGNWEIAMHPGVMNDQGEVERWAPVGGQAIMIFDETKYPQESFDFVKWWMSTETQSLFAFNLQTMFGEEYLWTTSNLEAFNMLPLPDEHKEVILNQWEWAMEASRVPGAYMVEREISNTWNKIVFDGANPRTTIDDAVILSNREIARKMEEFGYMENGIKLRDYRVPTIYNIDYWLTERRKED